MAHDETGIHLRACSAHIDTTMNGGATTTTTAVIKRGDIVWAMVHFPHNWLPALVLSSSSLAVTVSFFTTTTPHRTHFIQSELLSFEHAFPSLVSPHVNHAAGRDTFRASLHSALRFFGLSVVSGLHCRCQTGPDTPGSGHRFDPNAVLAFVLDAAVSPWVDTPRLVDAVRVVAQVHAFRGYSSIQQKRVCREKRKLGDNMKQHQCSSLGEKTHSVTQESVTLEPKEKYQIISEQGERNMAIGAMKRLNSTVPDLKESSEHLFHNKLVIIPEAPTINGKAELLMHSPALDPFYMVGEFLKSEWQRQSLLIFKNMSDQGIVDISFGNCSPMSKICFSVSSNFMTHLSNYISNREDNTPGLCCRFSDIETVMYLNRKRRRLDKPALCHVFPHQIGMVQESEGNAYFSKYTRPGISDIKMLEPEESIQKDTQACIRFCETNMNITDEVHNLTLKQSLTCESSSNLQLGLHPHTCKVPGAAKVKYIFGFNSSDFRKRLQKSCFGDITPHKSQLSAREKLTSGDFLVERKDSYPDFAPCSVFNSKAGHQSKTNVPFCSTSLHMKFPKNFNLPTKEQLIRKFSVFGSIDYLKTRVSYYTGSAQVAFFQQGEAVAAYRYAKKKKVLFSDANVQFWLDPFEHKRIGFERFSLMPPSSSKPTGPPLKSCLKKSNSLRQENKKKHQRVRFTVET